MAVACFLPRRTKDFSAPPRIRTVHTTWVAPQQVLGCRLPTSQARIQSHGRSYEICAAQSGKFSHFSRVNYHFISSSHSSIIRGWYNTPLEVTRNLLHSAAATITKSRCYLEWHAGFWTRRISVNEQRTREIYSRREETEEAREVK
jgi:hypothetical protein